MITRRQLASLALACLGLGTTAVQAQAPDKVVFQLDWVPGGDKAGIYAAVKQGFFSAEGLDVTVVSGRGSSDAVTKLATGAADEEQFTHSVSFGRADHCGRPWEG